ncbi:hypothetical protein K3495_g10263 [Podosphaera aphanis]|nr:hypothetical protein K3495_g10263 [Podosphaera aphanis]
MSLDQLSKLLTLPNSDLQQILDYANTLSNEEAADHFKNFLGNSPQVHEFICAYSSRREPSGKPGKSEMETKTQLKPTARKITGGSISATAYQKKSEVDYILPQKRSDTGDGKNVSTQAQSRAPPSAAGTLISDFAHSSRKTKGNTGNSKTTRNSSSDSAKKTKITISGGQSMHGASTTLSELDAAIRSLETSTNRSLKAQDPAARACGCIATRHPLLTATPNCLNCGKVICVKEGLGPCTFCGAPLLSAVEVQAMISSLKKEREREKVTAHNKNQRRAELASTPKPFSVPIEPTFSGMSLKESIDSAEMKARAHRDKLLTFQAQNAKRTTVHDEVSDFNIDAAAVERDMMWASPVERAKALKQQQKLLQEMEWNARPEYERRKVVVSLDVVGGKVIKKMGMVTKEHEFGSTQEETDNSVSEVPVDSDLASSNQVGGNLRKNPLLGGLIRPIWTDHSNKGKGVDREGITDNKAPTLRAWRRVQDDQEDNEELILDGGLSGGQFSRDFGSEPTCA